MKDNRPSRKESKAQENIREYLQDIAMGYSTHFGPSTVGMWKIRYRDFEKSLKQAWNDYEKFFDGVPVVNEVEPPEMEMYVIEDFRTKEKVWVTEEAKKLYDRLNKERIENAGKAIMREFAHKDLFDWFMVACLGCVLLPIITILFMTFR